jgi:hypothetical protein
MHHHPLNQKVYNYLHYGYLPPDKIPEFLTNLDTHEPIKPTVENTVELFDEIFTEVIEKSVGNGYCIIPVSGGWDSRILLGYALEVLPSKQIKTYTFGSEGQLDFDIGKKLAKKAGVEHVAFDLKHVAVSWDVLKMTTEKAPWTYIFDSFFNKYCYKQMSTGADMLLSGFMGDPLTGGHNYKENGKNIPQYFAKRQGVTNLNFPNIFGFNPADTLPVLPEETPFSDHQLLDLGVRQACCIAPIISFQKQWNSWDTTLGKIDGSHADIVAPFVHPKWIRYWVTVPDSHKRERKLYLDFLQSKFPGFAEIPSKDFYGARKKSGISAYLLKKKYHAKKLLNQRHPLFFNEPKGMLNYLDFDLAFRKREDYREVLERSLMILKDHSLADWLDFDVLKEEHVKYDQQHSKLILMLAGLALNIESREQL